MLKLILIDALNSSVDFNLHQIERKLSVKAKMPKLSAEAAGALPLALS